MKFPGWRLIDLPRDLRSVESFNHAAEVDPRQTGLKESDISAIWESVRGLYRSRMQPAISLCVRHRGHVILDRAIGHVTGNGPDDTPDTRKIPVRHDTPFCIFSASKAVTAMLIHLLDERGLLHIDDRVAEFIPEFAENGKEWVTIRHVLTHRAGIPSVPSEYASLDTLMDYDRVVQLLCETRPVSRPGRRLSYHAVAGGFVLGEIVQRVTGKGIREFLAEEVLNPLGFSEMNYGISPDELHRVAETYFTGPPVPLPLGVIAKRALGVPFEEAAVIGNDLRYLTSVVPAGNIVASANETSRFFQLLLSGGELNGTRVFEPRTIRRATNETAYLEIDFTLGFPVRYSLGLMLGAPRFSLFGKDTRRAYGHLGFINVLAWADPERDVAGALLTSGKPLLSPHLLRVADVMSRISERIPKL